ncbi:hypothetical protein H2198_004215 [Neophaeococcomyces mojaviensis]|uniref:Uncharacterized protein n=1 Tax=Neophaeococcomyces mojaviensis TaxID=3383035 RepID=A0ACC3A962_9EURO|nr:hypothetical protein H2198_004215 [Knufia sp. JES_112]
MPNVKPIVIDGSTFEGGGQLTRVALSLSAICNIPISIHSIRANRAPKSSHYEGSSNHLKSGRKDHPASKGSKKVEGGLKESHLAALQWLAAQCSAYVEGAEVGSREVTFIPGIGNLHTKRSNNARNDLVDLNTNTVNLRNPGSIWLIFQALYPFVIFGNVKRPQSLEGTQTVPKENEPDVVELTLHGGTNVSKSMSGEYVNQVFLPVCRRIGLPATEIEVVKRGWAGNAPQIGEVKVRVERPTNFSLPTLDATDRGDIASISMTVVASPQSTRNRLIERLRGCIAEHFGEEMEVDVAIDSDSEDPRRMYVLLVAHTSNGWRLGRDYLGTGRTPKNDAELGAMADMACQAVTKQLKWEVKRAGCVDEFMQDQLVVFQALAGGKSVVDGGVWKDAVADNEDEECGDDEGSLHTRTVRWVCQRMLGKKGVVFTPGGECVGLGWNAESETGTVEL